jgi:hypothetical protein
MGKKFTLEVIRRRSSKISSVNAQETVEIKDKGCTFQKLIFLSSASFFYKSQFVPSATF